MANRIVKVRNTTGGVVTFVGQRLQPSEEHLITNRSLPNWQDSMTVSGAITSGTLVVNDGIQDLSPTDGFAHLLDLDVDAIRISGRNYLGQVTLSGIGGVLVTSGTVENIVTVSGEPLPTTSGQAVQPDPEGNFITIARVSIGFGKDGRIDGAYMRIHGVSSSETGYVMIRPARLTGVAAFYPSGASQKDFMIRKNGDPTDLATFTVQEGIPYVNENFPTPVDFDTGDRIQVFVSSAGARISDPNVWLEIGWRAEE